VIEEINFDPTNLVCCVFVYLQASQKEETYSEQVRVLIAKHKEAEARAEFAERSVQKLQKEVDRLEDDLRAEQDRNKMLQEDMEATLQDIQNI